MIDVFFMRPQSSAAQLMKRRLEQTKNINRQDLISEKDVAALMPQPGSIFVFHLSATEDVALTLSQIRLLSKSGGPSMMNVVISELKDDKVQKIFEAEPQVQFYSPKRSVHDVDLLVQKLAKHQAASLKAPSSPEALVYTTRPDTFIQEGRSPQTTVTSEERSKPSGESAKVFKPLTDPEQKTKLMADAIDSQAAIVLSNFGSNQDIDGFLVHHDEKRQTLHCQFEGTPEEIADFRAKSETAKKIAMSISLRQSRVFFVTTDFVWTKKSTIEIAVPSLLYFVQRRKEFRLVTYPQGRTFLKTRIGTDEVSFEVYDLAAGGVSVICEASEMERLKLNPELPQSKVSLEGHDYIVGPLKFRQSQHFKTHGKIELFRAGYSFEKIPAQIKKNIADYVDRKARAYVMDYVVGSDD